MEGSNSSQKFDKTKKKGKYFELVTEVVRQIQPAALPSTYIRKMWGYVACVRYATLTIKYRTYMSGLAGLILVTVFDTRQLDYKKRIICHMNFPVGRDQDIKITLNKVAGPEEQKDPISVVMRATKIEAVTGTNYGRVKVIPTWDVSRGVLKDDEHITVETMPNITYVEGNQIQEQHVIGLEKSLKTVDQVKKGGKKYF
ncbi:TPA_asm: P3 [Justicia betacytorhabdovirus 1]|nr:TPA_asm: P3 [Justicia betacytorhabdovirus 1]